MPEVKSYDTLEPQEHHFTYRGEYFIARQADTGAKRKYQEAPLANSQIEINPDTGGKIVKGGLGNAAGMDSLLVTLCTFIVPAEARNGSFVPRPGAKEGRVTQARVDAWPPGMTEDVARWIKSVSGLDEAGDLATLKRQREEAVKSVEDIDRRISDAESSEDRLKN